MSLAIAPAPVAVRRRTLFVGTSLSVAAGTMLFGSMVAFYLARRDEVLLDRAWVPPNVKIPQIATNVMLATMIGAVITAQWAVWAIKRNDRVNAYLALGLTALFGAAVLNAQVYTWIQMRMVVWQSTYETMTYVVTGTFFAALIAGVTLTGVLAFQTLGGRYSSKDTDGLSSLALFWYFLAAAYAAVWLVVYVSK